MNFIVLTSPAIKSLITKYQGKISFQDVDPGILSKIKASMNLAPSEFKDFTRILSIIRKYLVENNITFHRESIKKLVGDGMLWKGLFNLMLERGDSVHVIPFEPGNVAQSFIEVDIDKIRMAQDTRVLMPLNLDETPELYSYFLTVAKLPVYPFIINVSTSKWLKNLLFAPYSPRSFYFPEGTNACEFADKILNITRQQRIETLILKDEYDADIRSVAPYLVIPTEKIELACRVFYEHIKGVSSFGGLVLEEFISTKDALDIYEVFIFEKMVRGQYLIDKVKLKPIQDGGPIDTLVIDKKTIYTNTLPINTDAIDTVVGKYYACILTSLEFAIHDGTPKVIDINSVSNSLRFDIFPPGLNPDIILNHFLDSVSKLNNEEELRYQIAYKEQIERIYNKIKFLGPAYFDRGKITSLVDDQIIDVVEFLADRP